MENIMSENEQFVSFLSFTRMKKQIQRNWHCRNTQKNKFPTHPCTRYLKNSPQTQLFSTPPHETTESYSTSNRVLLESALNYISISFWVRTYYTITNEKKFIHLQFSFVKYLNQVVRYKLSKSLKEEKNKFEIEIFKETVTLNNSNHQGEKKIALLNI